MTRWYQEKKHEHYYKEAKRVGYRARSAFKLKQIQNRFQIFKSNDLVIDLGGFPGGWSQVASEYIKPNGQVYAIDLEPIKPLERVITLQGDITDPQIFTILHQWLAGRKA
ncbi:MAG: RlmE family RNA methyltransferase, partial [Candidatus Thermoplasmatota archaeon]|nr:RlmE family RNA methyltransferase [Candidatus Thermoplasmatota archaeon]